MFGQAPFSNLFLRLRITDARDVVLVLLLALLFLLGDEQVPSLLSLEVYLRLGGGTFVELPLLLLSGLLGGLLLLLALIVVLVLLGTQVFDVREHHLIALVLPNQIILRPLILDDLLSLLGLVALLELPCSLLCPLLEVCILPQHLFALLLCQPQDHPLPLHQVLGRSILDPLLAFLDLGIPFCLQGLVLLLLGLLPGPVLLFLVLAPLGGIGEALLVLQPLHFCLPEDVLDPGLVALSPGLFQVLQLHLALLVILLITHKLLVVNSLLHLVLLTALPALLIDALAPCGGLEVLQALLLQELCQEELSGCLTLGLHRLSTLFLQALHLRPELLALGVSHPRHGLLGRLLAHRGLVGGLVYILDSGLPANHQLPALSATAARWCRKVQTLHNPIEAGLLVGRVRQIREVAEVAIKLGVGENQAHGLRSLQLVGRASDGGLLLIIIDREDVVIAIELLATLEDKLVALVLLLALGHDCRLCVRG
mmetsp:Transcript_131410/g.294034  ORF Transcript_131410/g.294034 Transcript_131410/m.294034 type:complete len:482 (-) Transcript_131410:47-1492(-)